MLTMYGIKNCDTIKKARRWLEAHQIAYQFHDYRADGLDRAQLDTFIAEPGLAGAAEHPRHHLAQTRRVAAQQHR